MGKYNLGVLGQISGKGGPVAGSSWKGISYLLSNPRKTKKRDVSAKIEIQRAKFKLASNFMKALASLLAIAFPDSESRTTSRNNALSSVLQQAVTAIIQICPCSCKNKSITLKESELIISCAPRRLPSLFQQIPGITWGEATLVTHIRICYLSSFSFKNSSTESGNFASLLLCLIVIHTSLIV